jgi:hypothetical protein
MEMLSPDMPLPWPVWKMGGGPEFAFAMAGTTAKVKQSRVSNSGKATCLFMFELCFPLQR